MEIAWDSVAHILVSLLTISLFYETALSVIFTWSLFQNRLKGKGFKVPISISISFSVFYLYDFDLFTDLLIALDSKGLESNIGGVLLTSLIVAGGSSGINGLLEKMNIRRPKGLSKND